MCGLPTRSFRKAAMNNLSTLICSHPDSHFCTLSSSHNECNPTHICRLSVALKPSNSKRPQFDGITIISIAAFGTRSNRICPRNRLSPRKLTLSPHGALLVDDRNSVGHNILPLLKRFSQGAKALVAAFHVPRQFLPSSSSPPARNIHGGLDFRTLTVGTTPNATNRARPFQLFATARSTLIRSCRTSPTLPLRDHFLRCLVNRSRTALVTRRTCPLSLRPSKTIVGNLARLLIVSRKKRFLTLRHTFKLQNFGIQLCRLTAKNTASASALTDLQGPRKVTPVQGRLICSFTRTPFTISGLRKVALKPQLPSNDRDLLLVDSGGFRPSHPARLVLLQLRQ